MTLTTIDIVSGVRRASPMHPETARPATHRPEDRLERGLSRSGSGLSGGSNPPASTILKVVADGRLWPKVSVGRELPRVAVSMVSAHVRCSHSFSVPRSVPSASSRATPSGPS